MARVKSVERAPLVLLAELPRCELGTGECRIASENVESRIVERPMNGAALLIFVNFSLSRYLNSRVGLRGRRLNEPRAVYGQQDA